MFIINNCYCDKKEEIIEKLIITYKLLNINDEYSQSIPIKNSITIYWCEIFSLQFAHFLFELDMKIKEYFYKMEFYIYIKNKMI